MAKVLGIGGVFFKCQDPQKLGEWYQEWLGLDYDAHGVHFKPETFPDYALTVWSPFPADTDYFDPGEKSYMFNFIVDDLEGVLAKAKAGGGKPVGELEHYDYGSFGWFLDPEGNKVELWQPAKPA